MLKALGWNPALHSICLYLVAAENVRERKRIQAENGGKGHCFHKGGGGHLRRILEHRAA
jgi:hypothetical protein